MKVTTGRNPYAYHQQKTSNKHTGFAALHASQAKISGESEISANTTQVETDLQKIYEEAAAQTTGVRSSVSSPEKTEDSAVLSETDSVLEAETLLSQEQLEYLSGKYDYQQSKQKR